MVVVVVDEAGRLVAVLRRRWRTGAVHRVG